MEIRKILFVCLLLLLSAICSQALDNDKIVNYYKSFIKSNYGKDVEVKVVDTETYKGFEVVKVEIDSSESLDKDEIEMLQDMIVIAVNEANKKVDAALDKKMGKFGNIPGLF